jgi:hypothetical protein
MKLSFAIILFMLTLKAYSQKPLTFPIVKDYYQFDWKSVSKEKDVPKSIKDFLIQHEELEDTILLRKSTHWLDLNNDGMDDAIYQGRSQGEGNVVYLFLNKGITFDTLVYDYQGVIKMEWENKKLKRLFITDWGCCSAYMYENKIYEFDFTQKNVVKNIYLSETVGEGDKPKIRLKTPLPVEVKERSKIRFSTQNDNKSINRWNGFTTKFPPKEDEEPKGTGNIMGTLQKGATGYAIGKTIRKGQEWWYVEINERFLPKDRIGYSYDSTHTKTIGWINGKYLKMK